MLGGYSLEIKSIMSGNLWKLLVAEGDEIKKRRRGCDIGINEDGNSHRIINNWNC